MSMSSLSSRLRSQPWTVPLTPDASGAAAANVARIQQELNAGRNVELSLPGVYYVDASIVVPSGRAVRIAPGVTLRAVPRASVTFAMFKNASFSAAPVSISGVTAVKFGVRNIRMTVTFAAAHGLSAGGHVLIKGDTTETVNGIWPIEAISSATVLTIVAGWPSPPSGYTFPTIAGTLTGVAADADIHIGGGGTLDANFHAGAFTMSNDWNDHAIALNNVLRPRIERLTFLDSRKYCVMAGNSAHLLVRDIAGYDCSDGAKLYGPAWHPVVDGVTGAFGDDACSFQTIDAPGYVQYQGPNSGGHFYGGTMRNIYPTWTDNSGSAVFYPNGGASSDLGYKFIGKFVVDGAGRDLRNSAGFASGAAFTLGNGYTSFPSSIDSLELRNISGGLIGLGNGDAAQITVESLVIDGYVNDIASNAQAATIAIEAVEVKSFLIKGLRIKNGAAVTTAPIIDLLDATAIIRSLTIEGGRIDGGTSGYLLRSAGGTLENATFVGMTLSGGWAVAAGNSTFASAPNIAVLGGYWNVTSAVFASGNTQAVNYTCNGMTLGGGALVNFYNASANIRMYVSGLLNPGGAATALNLGAEVRWYNPDGSAPIDLTKVKRIVNAIAAHTGDANNLYLCDSSGAAGSWKKMTNPAVTI